MNNPLPIEYLHKIRAEHWNEIKDLSPEERKESLRRSNERGKKLYEKAMARKAKMQAHILANSTH